MLAFLVQRISQAFLVMFVISVIAFAIQDGLGDPLQEMVGMSVSEEEREAIRANACWLSEGTPQGQQSPHWYSCCLGT